MSRAKDKDRDSSDRSPNMESGQVALSLPGEGRIVEPAKPDNGERISMNAAETTMPTWLCLRFIRFALIRIMNWRIIRDARFR